jgi:hypothetical protein
VRRRGDTSAVLCPTASAAFTFTFTFTFTFALASADWQRKLRRAVLGARYRQMHRL